MMKKIYEKPNAVYVSLIAEEEISTGSFGDGATAGEKDIIDGDTGVESSIF